MKDKKSDPIEKKQFPSINPIEKKPHYYLLYITVKPNSKADRIFYEEDRLCFDISTPPVKGKANTAVIKILKNIFKIPNSAIKIISGHTSHSKIVEIYDPNHSTDDLYNILLKEN